jgi:tetratricopeptide (TPR) repeat protein
MKTFILVLSLMTQLALFSPQMTYNQFKEEAKTDIRYLPKYGNAPKTKEQTEADNELIKDYLKQGGTHRKASDILVRLGFDYLYKGDLKTAMFRFNQAWLLDPKNENVFWGFGCVYFSFNDFQSALQQYDEGLTLNPASSTIITDKATVFKAKYETDYNHDIKDLNTSIDLFLKSYSIDSKNQNTLYKLSVCYLQKDDCKNARKYYNECVKLGGKPITKEYTDVLNKKCKN